MPPPGKTVDMEPDAKAAMVLIMLGEEIASELFKHLSVDEIKALNDGMGKVRLSEVDDDTQELIIEEYHEMLQGDDPLMLSDGRAYLRNLVERAMAEDEAKRLIEELNAEQDLKITVLDPIDPKTIANVVAKEHPQTIALILAYTQPDKSAQVLSQLPLETQVEVCLRMASLESVNPQVLRDIEEALKTEMKGLVTSRGQETSGVLMVAEILNSIEKSQEEVIFEQLQEIDPDLADEIRSNMFVFEDLLKIDDRGIQALLKEVDNNTLLYALKMAADELKNKIFGNLSSRAAEMIQEDMEVMGPTKLSEVEKAQGEITALAMKLEAEGKIVIAKGGGDEQYV
ncbi:MAG: flagellar motor switch protein FliG [Bradymonadia bacterium]